MPVRRVLTATVAATWLLPAAMAGGVALHVAIDHPAGHDREASHHVSERADPARAPHLHAATDGHHEHLLVEAPSDVAVRRGIDWRADDVATASDASFERRVEPRSLQFVPRPRFGPPKASGPPLLARLSTLRI